MCQPLITASVYISCLITICEKGSGMRPTDNWKAQPSPPCFLMRNTFQLVGSMVAAYSLYTIPSLPNGRTERAVLEANKAFHGFSNFIVTYPNIFTKKCKFLDTPPGFEPGPKAPEANVLPLHHRASEL